MSTDVDQDINETVATFTHEGIDYEIDHVNGFFVIYSDGVMLLDYGVPDFSPFKPEFRPPVPSTERLVALAIEELNDRG